MHQICYAKKKDGDHGENEEMEFCLPHYIIHV